MLYVSAMNASPIARWLLACSCGAGLCTIAATVSAGEKLSLPKVEPVETADLVEAGASPVYYRLPDNTLHSWARLSVGASSRLPVSGEEARTCFAVSIFGGIDLGWDRTSAAAVVVEAG